MGECADENLLEVDVGVLAPRSVCGHELDHLATGRAPASGTAHRGTNETDGGERPHVPGP